MFAYISVYIPGKNFFTISVTKDIPCRTSMTHVSFLPQKALVCNQSCLYSTELFSSYLITGSNTLTIHSICASKVSDCFCANPRERACS